MTVELYTDGACSGNPGPGGWCSILRYGKYEKLISGGAAETTNNRMELTAVIEGLRALNRPCEVLITTDSKLRALKRPCEVLITTDSKYVADSVSKGWVYDWQKRGWKKSDNKPVPNRELWEAFLQAARPHKLTFHWIKGHNGHPENERCDAEAVRQTEKYKTAP